MYWDQFAKGLKQLIAKAVSLQGVAEGEYPHPDNSIAPPSDDDRYDEAGMTPYSPDNHGERSDSSLHLSC
jgi:hypothetical protein